MIVVVEGPDGAGKTTLVQRLSERLASLGIDSSSTHHGPYAGIAKSGDLARQYFLAMTRSISYGDVSILDRSWLSEPIYASAYRKAPSRLKRAHVRMLERAALSRGLLKVLCLPRFETCEAVFGKRDEYIDMAALSDVYEGYTDILDDIDTIWNRDYENITHKVDEIVEAIERNPSNIFGGGGNYVDPKVLVLCGKWLVNNVREDAIVIPYLGFHNGPSPSVLLADAFDELCIPEHSMYWVNTQNPDGTPLSPDIMEVYDPDVVLAIGSLPEQWAKSFGVDATIIQQPKTGSEIDLRTLKDALQPVFSKGVL